MNKNSKRKLKHLFFLFSIMSLSLGLSVKTMEVHAESIENNIIEADVVSAINLDKDFDDSSVIVVLDKENSGINKIHQPEEFGLDDNYIIEDLTYLKWDISEYKYLNRENFKQILQIKLPISSKENVVETIGMLSTINGLISVEPNYLETQESVLPDNFSSENYSELWGLHGENGIKADMAWRYSTGSQTVKVGVIDGGIANHPDLNANVIEGWDFYNNNNITNDDPNGHGTAVAGVIGASGKSSNGVIGVCPNVQLVPMQVTYLSNDGTYKHDTAARIEAIMYAGRDISILNYSGGGDAEDPGVPPGFTTTKEALSMYTGLFICSAGNNGRNTDTTKHYPSDYADESNREYNEFSKRVISVGALQKNGEKRDDSNYGVNSVSIYAPGSNILTTSRNLGYSKWSQTSFATPHVTGVAALLLSIDPTLTGEEIKWILLNSADTISVKGKTALKLNAYEAVKQIDYDKNLFNVSSLSSDTVGIDGLKEAHQGKISIPRMIQGKLVTQINDEAFLGQTGITEVFIPNTVTHIGNAAFYNCTSLVNVAFEKNSQLSYISGYAFQQCLSLKSLTIPSTVTTISYGISSFGEKLTYYTDLGSDPSTWDNHWNKADWISIERPVVWGCTLSTDKSYVVSFKKTASNITKPNAVNGISAPYRYGYTFGGWYDNPNLTGTAISAENIATASNNVIYYAKWISNFEVVFDADNDSSKNHVSIVESGDRVGMPLTKPLKDGCVFKYWALSTNLNQEYNWNTVIENDIILQAVWEEIGTNYVVTFDLDGGEWTNNTQKLVSSGSTVNRPSSPTKVGYTFSHWALSGQTTSYNFSTPVTSDITLVAIWTPTTTRTVTFDTDGGYGDFPTITINQYGKIEEPEVEPVRAGYYFKYWALSTNLNQEYNWNASISQNITLVAVWESFNCIVTFDANGGEFRLYSLMLNIGDTVGEFLNGSSVGNPTRTGYTFKYWALSTNTSTAYNLNATITSTQTIRLVAVWNINTYTVTFDKAGGSGSTPNQTIAYGSTATKPSNPTRDGYTFKYWALSGGTTEYNFSTPITANVSLVAIWEKEESCVAAGTLITLADGRQVPVETLTGNEMLLVWNLHTGSFDVAPILFIDHDEAEMYKIINLQFSDGTQVKVIYEHAFWDFNLNKYVFLREDAAQYVGHWFNKQTTDVNGNMIWMRVQLTNVTITEEYTTAWSPVTYGHLCIYVNGMLSMPGATEGLINIFEVDGDTMQIDQEQYLADIATYGLFTYEEFAEIYPIPEAIFEAFGGEYLKVSIGKGLIDYETLGELIERYSEFFE